MARHRISTLTAILSLINLISIAHAQSETTPTASTATSAPQNTSSRTTAASNTSASPTTQASGNAVSVVTTSGSGTTHTIAVNRENGKFDPDSVLADVGEFVAFQFYPGNHSVARSEYGYPCIPYGLSASNRTGRGFWSGWKPFVAGDLPEFIIRINRVEPLWYYDAAPGYCQSYSMVGVINPYLCQTNTNQLAFQSSLAGVATLALAPGEPLPASATIPLNSSSAAANTSTSSSLSGGAIAGTVVGSIAGLSSLLTLVFFLLRRRKQRRDRDRRLKEAMEASALADAMQAKSPGGSGAISPRSAGSGVAPGRGIDSVISGSLWSDGEGTWRSGGHAGLAGIVESPEYNQADPGAVFVEAGGNEVAELSQYGDGTEGRVELPTSPLPTDRKRPFSYEGPFEMEGEEDEKDAKRRREKE
ncbi:hypothetical protein BC567DRAFT_292199 [Phyllosticta citribraziliensis]